MNNLTLFSTSLTPLFRISTIIEIFSLLISDGLQIMDVYFVKSRVFMVIAKEGICDYFNSLPSK